MCVFDATPTANARRLLETSKIHALWVDTMREVRGEALTLREMLSLTKKTETTRLSSIC